MPDIVIFDAAGYADDCRGLAEGFRQLPQALARKQIKSAMKKATDPFIPALRAATPKFKGRRTKTAAVSRDARGRFQVGSGKKSVIKPGALRRSIKSYTRFRKVNGGDEFTTKITFGRGKGKGGNVAHLVELGTGARATRKSKANRGGVAPRLFLRRTFDTMAPGIQSAIVSKLAEALESGFRQLEKYQKHRKR